MGVGNVTYVQSDGEEKFINTLFNLGDSKKELSLGVAQGFPNVTLNEKELLMPKDFQTFFGLSDAQIGHEKVELSFDLLKILFNTE